MPSAEKIITFGDAPAPAGASPFVPGAAPDTALIEVVEHDPAWAGMFRSLEQRVREALGFRVLALEHVGSTSVPGLTAKPVVDIDLVVADPDDEHSYLPPLTAAGFALRIREPWWYRHRMLRADEPRANLHVFGPESPEPLRHKIFRDWLRLDEQDRALYATTKAQAAGDANAAGEDVIRYNARKQQVVRAIYSRAFAAAGLLDTTSEWRGD